MKVSEFVEKMESRVQYAFSWEEIVAATGKSDGAIRRALDRLTQKGKIITVRHSFYLILPPVYKGIGVLPVQFYIDKLCDYLGRDYYLGLYSAAAFHGASHQAIMHDFIVTSLPQLKNIEKIGRPIEFYSASTWPVKNINKRKTETGYFNISSPALTAADLVNYANKIGGMNRIYTVLDELREEFTEKDIIELLTWYPKKSVLQRLGYMLENFDGPTIFSESIYAKLKTQKFYQIKLASNSKRRRVELNSKWKIDINTKLESDLW